MFIVFSHSAVSFRLQNYEICIKHERNVLKKPLKMCYLYTTLILFWQIVVFEKECR